MNALLTRPGAAAFEDAIVVMRSSPLRWFSKKDGAFTTRSDAALMASRDADYQQTALATFRYTDKMFTDFAECRSNIAWRTAHRSWWLCGEAQEGLTA